MNSSPTNTFAANAISSESSLQQRLEEALAEYHEATDSDRPIDREAFLEKYADVRHELSGYLDSFDLIHAMASELSDTSGASSSSRAALPQRAMLGDFRILREIGRGGMGVVYEAEQLSLGRRVALKVLPFAAMLDKQQLARFKNEARAAATLDHPNIVAIYSVGVERSVHFYAMQLIEGHSLAQVVEQLRHSHLPLPPGEGRGEGALGEGRREGQVGAASRAALSDDVDSGHTSPARLAGPTADTAPIAALSTLPDFDSREYFRAIAQLGIQAAEALDHAHQNGILHRDIKPANLLVDDSGKLWITDFGLARMEQDAGMTMTGDILGTLRYMSPEQALAKRVVVDHRSDIYSLGVTLYELLTLKPAFVGDDRHELLRQIAFDDPRSPRQLIEHIPVDLETIILKSIRKSPDQRYATAADLAEDLRRFLDNKTINARPPTWRDHLVKWSRRHQAAALAIVIVLALSTLVFAVSSLLIARERNAAVAARNTATEHFQLARSAVDKLMTRVAEEKLLNAPQMEQLRNSLLTDALDFYQLMLVRDGDNAPLRFETALAQRRVGEILLQLNRRDDAAKAQADAVRQLRQLTTDFPETPDYQLALAETLCQGGRSLELLVLTFDADGTESPTSKQHYEEALSILEGLHRALPNNREYAVALAKTYLMSVEQRRGPITEGVQRLTRARAVLEPIVLSSEAPIAHQDLYTEILCMLGEALPADAARKAYDDGKRMVRQLIQKDSSVRERRALLAKALWNSANRFPPENDDKLLAVRRECVSLFEGLVRDFPLIPKYRGDLAMALMHLAGAFVEIDNPEPDSAIQSLIQAKQILVDLCKENPRIADNYNMLERVQHSLVNVQQRYYQNDEWLKYIEEFVKLLEHRAEISDDHTKYLAAASSEWRAAKELISLGRQDEGTQWAEASFQHFRTFLRRYSETPKDLVHNLLGYTRSFCVELHDAGFVDEAAEFAQGSAQLAVLLIAEYRETIRLNPNDFNGHNQLAWLLSTCPEIQLRDPQQALELAKKAVELAPNEAQCWNTLGVAQYRVGDYREAINALNRSGQSSWEYFFLAMTEWQLGNHEAAREWYLKAIEWMEKNQPQDAELIRFRREAKELLGPVEPQQPEARLSADRREDVNRNPKP